MEGKARLSQGCRSTGKLGTVNTAEAVRSGATVRNGLIKLLFRCRLDWAQQVLRTKRAIKKLYPYIFTKILTCMFVCSVLGLGVLFVLQDNVSISPGKGNTFFAQSPRSSLDS